MHRLAVAPASHRTATCTPADRTAPAMHDGNLCTAYRLSGQRELRRYALLQHCIVAVSLQSYPFILPLLGNAATREPHEREVREDG